MARFYTILLDISCVGLRLTNNREIINRSIYLISVKPVMISPVFQDVKLNAHDINRVD